MNEINDFTQLLVMKGWNGSNCWNKYHIRTCFQQLLCDRKLCHRLIHSCPVHLTCNNQTRKVFLSSLNSLNDFSIANSCSRISSQTDKVKT
ncbi:Uncharacterised protein [Mycobacterium tuberculosis]|nr:Uncharacterised protein [Mycobacterium tuberculosis]